MTAPAPGAGRAMAMGFGAIATLGLVFGLWGTQTRLAGAVMATGKVEVDRNRQVVQNLDGGVVRVIDVREGDRVAAGQVLIVLDGTALQAQARQLGDQLLDRVARRDRLTAQRDGDPAIAFDPTLRDAARARPEIAALVDTQVSLHAAQGETLARELAQLHQQDEQIRSQVEGVEAQLAAALRERETVAENVAGQRDLVMRQLARLPELFNLQRQLAEVDGTIGALRAQKAQAASRQAELRIEALKLESAAREDAAKQLHDVATEALELGGRLRAVEAQIERLEIRAPAGGIVYNLTVTTPQQVIRPAEPLLFIVPQDRPLIVSARVPPLAVDDVSPGSRVRLRVLAFHDRLAPDALGTVETVSPDRLHDDRTRQDYYLVRISLDPKAVDRYGDHPILPGMPVEAYIRTGEQTPLAYILAPVSAYFDHAFHEG